MLVSKFGLRSVFFFIFFLVIGRLFLLPFGDEPDFEYRAYILIKGESQPWWTPYYYFEELIRSFSYSSYCIIDSSLYSYWSSINSTTCTENSVQSLVRICIAIFSMLPFLIMVVFRETTLKTVNGIGMKFSKEEWNYRLDVLCLVFVFHGFIYHVGVLAVEQFVLVLTIPIFLFWGRWLIILVLLALIASLDIGNFVVITTFVLVAFIFSKLKKKTIVFATITLILAALVLGISALGFVSNISFLSEKATGMTGDDAIELRNKYPIYLRPVITYLSSIILTPSAVKVIPAYIIYGIAIVRIIKNKPIYNNEKSLQGFYFIFSSLSVIIAFIFILPTYANAKYYIFMLPFIFYSVLNKTNKNYFFNFIIILNLVIYLHLFFYRL